MPNKTLAPWWDGLRGTSMLVLSRDPAMRHREFCRHYTPSCSLFRASKTGRRRRRKKRPNSGSDVFARASDWVFPMELSYVHPPDWAGNEMVYKTLHVNVTQHHSSDIVPKTRAVLLEQLQSEPNEGCTLRKMGVSAETCWPPYVLEE